MRTTLMIHDELYQDVKRLAVGRRSTVSKIVNDALRRELLVPAGDTNRARISIPVYGYAGRSPADTTPAEFDALLQEEETAP